MEKIFLISGQAESGKDLTADIIMKKLEGRSIKISMADYLKHMAQRYYNWDGKKDSVGRTILQQLGTDKIRDELNLQTFHVERVCQDIEIIADDYDYIFIPDVRFKDEMWYTMAKFPDKTISIRVNRPYHENSLTIEQRKHRSETELITFKHDYYISSGSKDGELNSRINSIMGELIDSLNNRYGCRQ